nr:reverse transcriptase domain, reverse transcriptase zinc-binding domain protein [Tanacetum cinerariifolium]
MGDSDWHVVNRRSRRSVFERLSYFQTHKSNVDDLAKISLSVYVFDFPSYLTVRKLWTICGKVGTLVDVNIANRKNRLATSYVNVAKAFIDEGKRGSKVIVNDYGKHEYVINLQVCSSNDFPLAILGCYKDFCFIANARTLCRYEGFLEVDIKYLGGLWVLFEFRTVDSRNKFLKHKGILSWFSSLKPWYDDFVVEERLVWLDIEGMPLRAWNNDTFNSIGSNCFATMMVSLKKVTYAIQVRELCSWTPFFVDEDSCKDKEGSMGSYNQDQEEECEIQENDVELHADNPNDIGDAHVKFNEEHEKAHNNTIEDPYIFKGSDVEP